MRYFSSLLLLSVGAALPCAASADGSAELNPIPIREWKVPYTGRSRDPFVVASDQVWFAGQSTHFLARLNPSTGEFFKRDLDDGAGPHNLIVDAQGIVWYAGNLKSYIGRYDPDSDQIEKITMPDGQYDPHTLVFDDDQSHIWFTMQHGNAIGRLNIASRDVDIVPVPTPKARPYGIRMGPDGTPWVVLLGTNKLASVDAGTMALTEYEMPQADARPRRLEVDGDGRIWYADYARGYAGVYDPENRSFTEYPLPSAGKSKPYGTAIDKRGRFWVVETGVLPNLFVGLDTRSGRVVSVTPIASQGGSVRHMDYHGPTDTVWFGTDAHTIGRAEVGRLQVPRASQSR